MSELTAPVAETLRVAALLIDAYEQGQSVGQWYLDPATLLRNTAGRDDLADAWNEFRQAAYDEGLLRAEDT